MFSILKVVSWRIEKRLGPFSYAEYYDVAKGEPISALECSADTNQVWTGTELEGNGPGDV